jgi:hypothetical protein
MVETELVEYAERKPKNRNCDTRPVILNFVENRGLEPLTSSMPYCIAQIV